MKKQKKQVEVQQEYTVILSIFGKRYTAKGSTVAEALAKLEPGRVKGKSILTVRHGEVSKDRVLQPAMTFKLFNGSSLMREIALKNCSILFNGI